MTRICVASDESFGQALRRCKKTGEMGSVLSDVRRHEPFAKPPERRERKLNEAWRTVRRMARLQGRKAS